MIRARRPPILAAVITALVLVIAVEPAAGQVACAGHTTIRDGDTLVAIAARCGVTVPALLAANPAVHADEDLRIGGSLAVPHPGAPQPRPQQACGAFYTIRDGDTVAAIAQKCGLTVPLLLAANSSLPDPLGLHAGGTIRIPDVSPVAVRDTLTWAAATPAPSPAISPAPAPGEEPVELVRAEGTLAAGSPCMLLRATDGTTIALAGQPSQLFDAGESVVVLGVPAGAEACGRTPALAVRILYRPNH